jgi:hypothetical protein
MEKEFVSLEKSRYENLLETEMLYEMAINSIKDFISEDYCRKIAIENDYADSNGTITDWKKMFYFWQGCGESIVGTYEYVKKKQNIKTEEK